MKRGSIVKTRGVTAQLIKYNLRSAPGGDTETKELEVSQVGIEEMASSFQSRDDPEYIKCIEDELLQSRQAREQQTSLLQSMSSKLEKLEITSTAAATTVGRGILRTPLRTTSPVPGVGRGAPSLRARLLSESTEDMRSAALGPSHPVPSDLVNGPLTSVLQQLSVAIDPTPQQSTKGLLLRPEYYIQHKDKGISVKSLDHSKLTYKELISGMGRVMLHLAKAGGDLVSYVEHFNFIARQAAVHNFVDFAYVSYERYVVDQYINKESDTFIAGDLLGVALHFHAGNLLPTYPSFTRGRGRGFRRGNRQPWHDQDRERDRDLNKEQSQPMLEGFPEDVCYNYNYRVCTGKCKKSHVCRNCRGLHKASSGYCQPSKK